MCIDDPQSITIAGSYDNNRYQGPELFVNGCVGKSYCKNQTEITEFLSSGVQMVIYHNTHQYFTDTYERRDGVGPVQLVTEKIIHVLPKDPLGEMMQVKIQKQTLEYEDNFLGLGMGFTSKSETFYITERDPRKFECFGQCVVMVSFSVDLTTQNHKRAVLTVWDVLGNVGGLYGILVLIGQGLVSAYLALVGSNLERFITARLFFFEKHGFSVLANQNTSQAEKLKSKLDQRKPAKFGFCIKIGCCVKRKRVLQLRQAEERFSRELDLVRYLQQQFLSQLTRKVLFDRVERFLMRNSRD